MSTRHGPERSFKVLYPETCQTDFLPSVALRIKIKNGHLFSSRIADKKRPRLCFQNFSQQQPPWKYKSFETMPDEKYARGLQRGLRACLMRRRRWQARQSGLLEHGRLG